MQKFGRRRRRRRELPREDEEGDYELFEDVDVDVDDVDAGPEAAAILLSAEHRGIGWMCGEPMADYAHVVFQARR